MCTVVVVICGIVVVVREVPASGIVYIAIPVVINPVACDLAGIGPYIGREIGMIVVDSRIDDTDDHRA